MAESGERRMLFDTRGRRRNVIRVVYAVLALLMGGSLFLTVGPFNLSELVGGGTTDPADVSHEQEERLEARLANEPDNPGLLLNLTRVRIGAAQAQTDVDPQTGLPGSPPPDALDDYDQAVESWNRYVTLAGDDVSPSGALLVAQTYFGLAERGSFTFSDIQENLETAVRAQRIAAEATPNPGTLSSLAIYEYFNGNFKAGDKATARAVALAPKAEAENARKQLTEFRKRAKRYVAQSEQLAKTQQEAGGDSLQNPFGGFGAGAPGAPGE